MAQQTPAETTALLTRLSQKPGVTATLILSRTTGAVVRASGLSSSSETKSDISPEAALAPQSQDSAEISSANGTGDKTDNTQGDQRERDGKGRLRNAEDVAQAVWRFFARAGDAMEDMLGSEDEVKLVRLRTRKHELVVVPDAKFLLVVVHDTPSA